MRKKKHQHCQFCMNSELMDADDTCCICVAWKPRTLYLPPEMSLSAAEEYMNDLLAYEDKKRMLDAEEEYALYATNSNNTQYGCHDHRVLKEINRRESDKYIEALNGARIMRYEEYDRTHWWMDDYQSSY